MSKRVPFLARVSTMHRSLAKKLEGIRRHGTMGKDFDAPTTVRCLLVARVGAGTLAKCEGNVLCPPESHIGLHDGVLTPSSMHRWRGKNEMRKCSGKCRQQSISAGAREFDTLNHTSYTV